MRTLVMQGIFGMLLASVGGVCAQVQLVPTHQAQAVFGGQPQTIRTHWYNAGKVMIETDIRMRTLQLTSATAAVVNEAPWKTLRMLPGQTISETVTVQFPPVKAETRFLMQWLTNSNFLAGGTEVCVYPTNLLHELKLLLGENGLLGVFDPKNELKESLKNAAIEFVDLNNTTIEDFRGTLAIIGPFRRRSEMSSITPSQIKTLAKNGVGVVWAWAPTSEDSPSATTDELQPSFYSVSEKHSATIVVEPRLLRDMGKNPRAQLNLIHFCKMALAPKPVALPTVKNQSQR